MVHEMEQNVLINLPMRPHLAQLDVLGPGWFHPAQAGL